MALRFSPARGAGSISLSSYVRGPQGAAATVDVGTVTDLAEGSSPTVSNSGTTSAATFNFGIPRGSMPAIGFNFDTSTTDSDPGNGKVRFNNATPASVTAIYFDNQDRDGNTVTSWLDAIDDSTSRIRGVLYIVPASSPASKLVYAVTGSVVDGTGYRKLTVSQVAGTTLPASGAHLGVMFAPSGNIGISAGFIQTFSATTADADPGNGTFRLNNATPSSATAAYLDNLDTGGTTVSAIMDRWATASATIKGNLRFVNLYDPTIWAEFEVTGSIVDGTGYRKVTLQNGVSSGSFTGDFVVTFLRAGSNGSYAPGGTDVALADGGTGASLVDPNADRIMFWDDSAGSVTWLSPNNSLAIVGTELRVVECHGIALSDEVNAITTGTNKATMSLPYAFTVTNVYATLNTVSSSGTPTVDINEAGTTILSTKLTIDANEKTSATAATAAVISDASIAANAEIGFDIDVAGTGAKGLKVFIEGYRS